MLKKLSLIILISVLAYSQVGYHFVIKYSQYVQKKAIKKEIRNLLQDAQLETISLTDNHRIIQWVEYEKEFLLNGEMYDVVRRKTVNGKEILYCINDKKEKALIDTYNLVTKHNSTSGKKSKHTATSIINLFVYTNEEQSPLPFGSHPNDYPSFESDLSENIMDIISPPPRV